MTEVARIEIDLNVRCGGRGTYSGYEDVQAQRMLSRSHTCHASAPVAVGEKVIAFESESGIMTDAVVTDIWHEKQIIYLAVDWHGFRDDPMTVTHVTRPGTAPSALCGAEAAPERFCADPEDATCTPCYKALRTAASLNDAIREGLEAAECGETENLGSFAQYAGEEEARRPTKRAGYGSARYPGADRCPAPSSVPEGDPC